MDLSGVFARVLSQRDDTVLCGDRTMTEGNDKETIDTGEQGQTESGEVDESEKDRLKRRIDEMKNEVMAVLEEARASAHKTWTEDKEVLKEKLVDLDKLKERLEARFEQGKVEARKTWDEDAEDLQKRLDEVKKTLKGGWDNLTEKTAALLNKLLD